MTTANLQRALVLDSALERYYQNIQMILWDIQNTASNGIADNFVPGFNLPALTHDVQRFLSPSTVAASDLGVSGRTSLILLDLMRNPQTRTTKTFASLVMVLRAVHYIRATGRRVMLITPSSANKATALRDAVLRAIRCNLVSRDELQITSIVPASSYPKLWSSPLSADPELGARNPLIMYEGKDAWAVKTLARGVYDSCASNFSDSDGTDLWYTLDINNYKVADAIRAFFESDFFPPDQACTRLHAHAVSSAFGLLGHNLGHNRTAMTQHPRYFLVQHMQTPDMVLSLHFGSMSHDNIPPYRQDESDGLYRQNRSPYFPATTFDPHECIDGTFYTRQPTTSGEMNALIHAHGGGGIVVSLHECLGRYAEIRERLTEADIELPADATQLREWSLVMAVTGVLNAIDRGLATDPEVVIHGSGCYSEGDYSLIPSQDLHIANTVSAAAKVAYAAVGATRLPAKDALG
jgi:hypothetical protein